MKSIYLSLLLLVAASAAPRSSLAGPAEARSDAETSARDHFQRGQRLSAAGDYVAAYREFAAGYALTELPLFLFNMAEAARASGDLAKARDNYQQFLRADPSNALAATAQTRLAEIDRAAVPDRPTPTGTAPPTDSTAPPRSASPQPGAAPRSTGSEPAVTTAPARKPTETPRLVPPSPTVPSDSVAAETLPPAPPPESPRGGQMQVWKRWPFWAVVGGVVVGSAVIYAVSRDDSPFCGADCRQIDFR